MKRFRFKKEPYDKTGLFFGLTGFLLTLLCLIGCQSTGAKGLYFAKVTGETGNLTAYYGWIGYCVEEDGSTLCDRGSDILVVPLDVAISDQLNTTHAELFKDPVSQDSTLNPGSAPNAPHNPRIYPAAVMCLLSSGLLLALGSYRVYKPQSYLDEHYTRGFLAAASTVFGLLLVALSSVMYQNAIEQLNKAYPHLSASEGPCMPMIGMAFACFFLASIALLRGVLRFDSEPEGYNAI